MKLIACALVVVAFLMPLHGPGNTLVCRGTMASTAHYTEMGQVTAPRGTLKLVLEIPTAFNATLFGYSERLRSFAIHYSKRPDEVAASNGGIRATWANPPQRLRYAIDANLSIDARVNGLDSESRLPVKQTFVSDGIGKYLAPSKYVQSADRDVKRLAKALVNNTRYESAAVAALMLWVSDNIKYDSGAARHDATWTLRNKRGTCENYAHLSLALLRSAGIPARYVSGYLTGGEVTISGYITSYEYRWDAGPHSWIEVYYPDGGWVPYEPQKTLGFVDTNHVRESAGADSADLPNRLVYTYTTGYAAPATVKESAQAKITHESSSLQVIQTSAASSQVIISQQMAHGGVVNDRVNSFSRDTLLNEYGVPIVATVAVIATCGFLFACKRRR